MISVPNAYNNEYATVRANTDEGRVKKKLTSEDIVGVKIIQIRICKRRGI